MIHTFSYAGHSGLARSSGGSSLNLLPNLSRERVAFDGGLLAPLRFREAMSALHAVVTSDLRYHARDKSAYIAWQEQQKAEFEARVAGAQREIIRERGEIPEELEKSYAKARGRYWKVRRKYSNYLLRHDPRLWRHFMPCDPIVTVAPDTVLFEGFSVDESSYGCLSVARSAFDGSNDAVLGTTNVDYSQRLYDELQHLRTYRNTRLRVDPEGFEVASEGREDYREEKIDLPESWLRGFLQLQAAMGLPMRRVRLPREAVYAVLAWLRRRRARKSPRAIRFELIRGRPPVVVLEPWEKRIETFGPVYDGPPGEPVRIWGRRRLLALARTLPLTEHVDVHLLGTGLPSFWVAHMGEMRLTLGLSGWTTNDWSGGLALDQLLSPAEPSEGDVGRAAAYLQQRRSADFAEIESYLGNGAPATAAVLCSLARTGQCIHDLAGGVFRFRQVVPFDVDPSVLVSDDPERLAAHEAFEQLAIGPVDREDLGARGALLRGTVHRQKAEVLLDADGGIRRGKCGCTHHNKYGIRRGPCRHLLALRIAANTRAASPTSDADTSSWTHVFDRLRNFAPGSGKGGAG